MKFFGNNISDTVWQQHLNSYSPYLLSNRDKYLSIVLSNHGIIPAEHYPYLCPLCLKNYFMYMSGGIVGNAEFSLDHLPPESVGGKFTLLTCTKCNNTAGVYEAELLRRLEFGSLSNNSKSILTKTTIQKPGSNEEYRVFVTKDEDGTTNINLDENAIKHNPKVKLFHEKLKNNEMGELTIKVEALDEKKILKAILKSAYLMCFNVWGYDFCFSKTGEFIRKVLNDEMEYLVVPLWYEKNVYNLNSSIGILRKPANAKVFFVVMDMKNDIEHYSVIVLIANPTLTGWQELEEFDKYMRTTEENINWEFHGLPQTVPHIINGYTDAWNDFIKSQQ